MAVLCRGTPNHVWEGKEANMRPEGRVGGSQVKWRVSSVPRGGNHVCKGPVALTAEHV